VEIMKITRTVAVGVAAVLGLGYATVSALAHPGGQGAMGWGHEHHTGHGAMGYGMMGGYGMGHGMMGGYGMGPGMMGGYGMGPGRMGGYGPGYGYGPDLSHEQREKIANIRQEFAQMRLGLMTSMHGPGGAMEQVYSGDEKAARQGYEAMAAARKQMFEASLDMRKKIEAVLTPEQREQLQRNYRGRRVR
jgi:Spy/CpxP family protein refolding chaperone